MYHHHHACRSSTSQYNASLFLAPPSTHAFILCNCPFSLSALSILFSLVPGGRCTGNSLACRMFSCSCTVWVSLAPRSPRSLQFFRIDRNLSPFSPRLNTLLVLVTLIICSRSFLLLVLDIPFPSASSTRLSYYLPFPPTSSDSLATFLFIIGSTQQLCIFLAILFLQFYCTTVLFIPTTPKVHRCPYIVAATKARSVALFLLSHRLRVVMSGIWE